MSDEPFRLIKEVKVGTLEGELREEWERLYKTHLRLTKEQEAYEEALDTFVNGVHEKFGSFKDAQKTDAEIHVSPEGDIMLNFCECPNCQSELQGMTVLETVEAMFGQKMIPDSAIEAVRRKAKALDAKREVGKKMLN